jgi:hypothetical protein
MQDLRVKQLNLAINAIEERPLTLISTLVIKGRAAALQSASVRRRMELNGLDSFRVLTGRWKVGPFHRP